MTDLIKIEQWAYPLKADAAPGTDPQPYYAALAKAGDGFYPVGGNGLWHGGVHLDEASGLIGANTEVRCIADGQVVAYRIDATYPVSEYADTAAMASTGFVLVKHRLEMPVPSEAADAPPALVFYSLYMHLACQGQGSGILGVTESTLT